MILYLETAALPPTKAIRTIMTTIFILKLKISLSERDALACYWNTENITLQSLSFRRTAYKKKNVKKKRKEVKTGRNTRKGTCNNFFAGKNEVYFLQSYDVFRIATWYWQTALPSESTVRLCCFLFREMFIKIQEQFWLSKPKFSIYLYFIIL